MAGRTTHCDVGVRSFHAQTKKTTPMASAITTTTPACLLALRPHALWSVNVGDRMSRGYAAATVSPITTTAADRTGSPRSPGRQDALAFGCAQART